MTDNWNPDEEMSSYDKGFLSERFDQARFDVYSTLDSYGAVHRFLVALANDVKKWSVQ